MQPDEVVDAFLRAVEAGDLAAVRAAYDPAAVIWHSHDGVSQSVEDNLATLAWIANHLGPLRYINVRRYAFAGGVVEQHDTVVPVPGNAEPLLMPACLVVLVGDDGKITRVDEYV